MNLVSRMPLRARLPFHNQETYCNGLRDPEMKELVRSIKAEASIPQDLYEDVAQATHGLNVNYDKNKRPKSKSKLKAEELLAQLQKNPLPSPMKETRSDTNYVSLAKEIETTEALRDIVEISFMPNSEAEIAKILQYTVKDHSVEHLCNSVKKPKGWEVVQAKRDKDGAPKFIVKHPKGYMWGARAVCPRCPAFVFLGIALEPYHRHMLLVHGIFKNETLVNIPELLYTRTLAKPTFEFELLVCSAKNCEAKFACPAKIQERRRDMLFRYLKHVEEFHSFELNPL